MARTVVADAATVRECAPRMGNSPPLQRAPFEPREGAAQPAEPIRRQLGGLGEEIWDQLTESIGIYTAEGECLYVNPVAEQMFGKPRQEVLGRIVWDVYPESRGSLFHQAFERVARTHQAEQFEHFNQPRQRWFDNRIYWAEGKVWALASDITEQRRATARLKVLAEASRAFSEVSLDPDQLLHTVCREVSSQLGDSCTVNLLSVASGRLELAATHHPDPEVVEGIRRTLSLIPATVGEGAVGMVAKTGQPLLLPVVPFEQLLASARPEYRAHLERYPITSLLISPLKVSDEIIGTITVARDRGGSAYTTEDLHLLQDLADRGALALTRAQRHRELQLERQRLDAVLRQMPSAVALVEAPSGKLILSNGQNAAIFKQSNPATEGMAQYRAYKGIHPDGREVQPEEWPLSRSILHGEVIRGEEIHVVRGDGTHAFIRCNSAPVRDEAGRIVAGVVTYDDVTEERHAKDERERLLLREQEAVRARDEFLAVASHELKTPLTSLKLQAQTLRRQSESAVTQVSPDRLRRFHEQTDKNVDRLARLVDDMLDITQLRSGKFTLKPERFDLTTVVREVLARHAAQLQEAKCEVEIGELTPVFGRWDRYRIDQVITNLITNATRYGAGKPISITAAAHPEGVELRVRDSGRGVDPDDHERIFRRFERAVPPSEISGLGLGLYIVRQIVEMHGGSVRVESVLGKGASFIVSLPVAVSPPLQG